MKKINKLNLVVLAGVLILNASMVCAGDEPSPTPEIAPLKHEFMVSSGYTTLTLRGNTRDFNLNANYNHFLTPLGGLSLKFANEYTRYSTKDTYTWTTLAAGPVLNFFNSSEPLNSYFAAFRLGFSIEDTSRLSSGKETSSQAFYYEINAGRRFELTPNFTYMPNIQLSQVPGNPISAYFRFLSFSILF